MDSLLNLPGLTSISPFCFLNEQHQAARCDLVVHTGHSWAIATSRADNPGGELALHLPALARAVCNTYRLNPERMVLLVRYQYQGGEHYYSTHFKHQQQDFFGEWTFTGASRARVHEVDVEAALQMLASGNEHVSVLRVVHPTVPTLLNLKRPSPTT